MATTFINPQTISLFIEPIQEKSINEGELIEKLENFTSNDKIIDYQLQHLKENLGWYSDNSVNTLDAVQPSSKNPETPKDKKAKKPKKGGSKWN